jgi:hypothetical protein
VQACVALVGEIWIAQGCGIVAHDTLDKLEVIQVYGSPKADGYFNPVDFQLAVET